MSRFALAFAVASILINIESPMAHAQESITVTVLGKLQTGVAAIGGETTGVTITAREITWELEFGKNEELSRAADKWNGQQVTVSGSLERRAGVEVKQRWIVTVSSLQGPEAAPKKDDTRPAEKIGRDLPGIKVNSTPPGTKVVAAAEQDRTVIDIRCDRGIGSCVMSREGDAWPKQLVFRLWLKGLESFQVTSGNTRLEWSVPSTGDANSSSTIHSGKRVSRLSKNSDLFSFVKLVPAGDDQPRIPLASGYFEVPLPASFLAGNPQELKLQWVDFYR